LFSKKEAGSFYESLLKTIK
jgi:alkylated DNA repair dioxygenase AlkB